MNKINKNHLIIGTIILLIILVIIIYIASPKNQYTSNYENLEISSKTQTENEEKTEETTKIKVHIAGAVEHEGIVELEEGARIADAIEEAGGTTTDANMKQINLAYKIQDGQKIYIPNQTEEESGEYQIIEQQEEMQNNAKAQENIGLININTATQTELELLSGIGPSTAEKIIIYRKENGKYQTKEDIKNVPGIGEAKYESIKDNITI